MAFKANELCPTCHSRVDPTGKLRKKGAVTEIEDDVPLSSNTGEVPQWSDDPCLTANGLNGNDFIGRDAIRTLHIEELQETRKQEELDSGIDESLLTKFTDIKEQTHVRKAHVIELRQSTEKILKASGSTLKEYFSTDPDGNTINPNPNDPAGNKDEWTDVARGLAYIDGIGDVVTEFDVTIEEKEDSPSIPNNTRVRGIHIEDLRHPLIIGVPALMIEQTTEALIILQTKKTSGANFIKAEPCIPVE